MGAQCMYCVWSESMSGPFASQLILRSQGDVEARGSPSQKAWRERLVGPRGAGYVPQPRALTKGSGFIYHLCFDSRGVLSMSDAMTGLNWILWSYSSRAGGGQIKDTSRCVWKKSSGFLFGQSVLFKKKQKAFLEKALKSKTKIWPSSTI